MRATRVSRTVAGGLAVFLSVALLSPAAVPAGEVTQASGVHGAEVGHVDEAAAVRAGVRALADIDLVAAQAPAGTVDRARETDVRLRKVALGSLVDPAASALAAQKHAAPAATAADFSMPIPGQMVGLTWQAGDAASIEIRTFDGESSSAWTQLPVQLDEGPDLAPGSQPDLAVGPVWVGTGVDRVEVRVVDGALDGVTAHVIQSVDDGPRQPEPAATVQAQGVQTATVEVIMRPEWDADEALRNSAPDCEANPEYAQPHFGVIHHTVNPNDYSASEADDLIRGIYAFHVRGRNFCDIGYNFIVDRFGRVYEGRYGGIYRGVEGAHAQGFNDESFGAALLGDFGDASPSDDAYWAMVRLFAWKLRHHGIDPEGTATVESEGSTKYDEGELVTVDTIIGHRDVSLTECPGQKMYDRLDSVRAQVPAVTDKVFPRRAPCADAPESDFSDRPAGGFGAAIDCIRHLSIASGYDDGTYRPFETVTRGQMATFLVNTIDAMASLDDGGPPATTTTTSSSTSTSSTSSTTTLLPTSTSSSSTSSTSSTTTTTAPLLSTTTTTEPGSAGFSDIDGDVHEENIRRLARLGITQGYSDGTYRPRAAVSRQQMATFVARTVEHILGDDLAVEWYDWFRDDDFSVHEDLINRLTEIAIITGVRNEVYEPNRAITRLQMALFLSRVANYVAYTMPVDSAA